MFAEVQMNRLFSDSKTFADSVPLKDIDEILKLWKKAREEPDFDLKTFVLQNFQLPTQHASNFMAEPGRGVSAHITALWTVLTRQPQDQIRGGSLIPLPHPYVVPGGRFREIYYWDSYFTMLGLMVDGRSDLIRNLVDNFAYLIDQFGFVPNGNRTYFLSRSQPPFFSLMVELLSEIEGLEVLLRYLNQLEKEYAFWMNGSTDLKQGEAHRRVVRLQSGSLLNRYYDDDPKPRPESFCEDVELAKSSIRKPEELWRDVRAACESGWDFSSRWLEDSLALDSIITTQLIPIDLNCLLLHLEQTLSKALELAGRNTDAQHFAQAAGLRSEAIHRYNWNQKDGWYEDFNFLKAKGTGRLTLATVFPLFFKIASPMQAQRVALNVENLLLKPGGLLTTPVHSGQQWDAPNGWAPLQWLAIQGFRNYGLNQLADAIRNRWVALNKRVYENTGKLVEKYNVEDMNLPAGGGEYPLQDGFGWTNGVLKRLLKEIGEA